MDALQFLFGFEGRVARLRFWIFGLILYALGTLALSYEEAVRGTLLHMLWMPGAAVLTLYIFSGMWGFSIAVALSLVLGWMVIAVAAKRLHDRNKSGWWLILFVVAPATLDFASGMAATASSGVLFIYEGFFLHLWSFVEMGCFPGVPGPNEYGPDPLALSVRAAA